jgi:hypothetical protein
MHSVFLGFLFFLILQLILCKKLDAQSGDVVNLATWALKELVKLSDTGIYDTLSLHRVISAIEEDGIYHKNTILNLELKCPYFKSKKTVEQYNIVVMHHLSENYSTIAIDEFPVMDNAAIEEYYIQKLESRRLNRIKALERLKANSL